MAKPRYTYAKFEEMKYSEALKHRDPDDLTLDDFRQDTVGWMIQRRIEESRQPGSRQLGLSHEYTFRALQKAPIAAKPYPVLKALDFIDHCKARRATGALPQTVMSDMSALSGLFTH